MNWDAIGAVSELLSAIGVIVTLAYLALQIRQSNKIASWQSHQASVIGFSRHASEIVRDADTARVLRVGLLDMKSLGSDDLVRFQYCLTDAVLMFKDILDAHDKGLFDQATYQAWEAYIAAILNMPGGDIWWSENRTNFIERLREVIDGAKRTFPRYDQIAPSFWKTGSP